jgi:CheY-like chemotaxis protein
MAFFSRYLAQNRSQVNNTPMTRRVVAAVTDLFFIAKIQGAARRADVELSLVSTVEELLAQAAEGTDLVVLDLNDFNIDTLKAIQRLKAQPATASVPLLGFVSHVDADLTERAEVAGCDRVVPRSGLSAKLVEFLRG